MVVESDLRLDFPLFSTRPHVPGNSLNDCYFVVNGIIGESVTLLHSVSVALASTKVHGDGSHQLLVGLNHVEASAVVIVQDEGSGTDLLQEIGNSDFIVLNH